MVQRDADAADVRIPPPLVYAASIAAGIALQAFVYRFDLALPLPARIAAAALSGGAGVALVVAALGAFRRTGQDPKPWKTTPEFVATGAYRWSRNPMYMGMGLLQAGLAFGLANGWLLVLVPAALGAVYVIAIRPEEAYLEAKFGASYVAFKQTVRRWL